MAAPEALLRIDLDIQQAKTKSAISPSVGGILGGALLVTGTCIGAGMLGLPVQTAASGLTPTLLFMLLVWSFMTLTALLMLEASLFLRGETNLISMAKTTLGPWGGRLAWGCYLLFLYSLMAAYTSGGTTMLSKSVGVVLDEPWTLVGMTLVFVVPFMALVYKGAAWVDYINRGFVVGLLAAFVMLTWLVKGHSNPLMLFEGESKYLTFTLPLLVTSFGFHLLIPSLKTYLREDVQKLRWAILIGSFIPLLIYFVWVYVTFSLIPAEGEGGLIAMLHGNGNPGELLIEALGHGHAGVLFAVTFFTFLALTSSFVGVALGLFDFFSDGLHIRKSNSGRCVLAVLTFLPPMIFTLASPRGFLLALGYAGTFASILLIIYPALMAWSGRYVTGQSRGCYQVVGGKPVLMLVIAFGVLVILAELGAQFHWLPLPY